MRLLPGVPGSFLDFGEDNYTDIPTRCLGLKDLAPGRGGFSKSSIGHHQLLRGIQGFESRINAPWGPLETPKPYGECFRPSQNPECSLVRQRN